MICIRLNINPADIRTAQQKGVRVANVNGRNVAMHYVKPSVRKSQELLERQLKLRCVQHEFPDATHAWLYRVEFHYGSTNRPVRQQGTLKITRPDGDNLTKGLLDAITATRIAWADDAQAHCAGEFRYWARHGEKPHIILKLKMLEQTTEASEGLF